MTDDREHADMNLPDDATGVPVDATPEYLAMLRQVAGPVPTGDVDWDDFHARLNARAALALVRLRTSSARDGALRGQPRAARRAQAWWEYVAVPSRVWRAVAAAASIAIAASAHMLSSDSLQSDTSDAITFAMSDIAGARGAFESAVTAGTPSGSIASYLVPTSADRTQRESSDSSTER